MNNYLVVFSLASFAQLGRFLSTRVLTMAVVNVTQMLAGSVSRGVLNKRLAS